MQKPARKRETGKKPPIVEIVGETGEEVAPPPPELVMDSDRFDVVFSDIVMPDMTGLDLAQAVRDRGIGVPVVLTTGYSEALSQDGKIDFELVQKPYAIDQLSRVLHRLARRRRVRNGAAE